MIYLASIFTFALVSYAIKLELADRQQRAIMKKAKKLAIYTDADGKCRVLKFACENGLLYKDAEYAINSQTGQNFK